MGPWKPICYFGLFPRIVHIWVGSGDRVLTNVDERYEGHSQAWPGYVLLDHMPKGLEVEDLRWWKSHVGRNLNPWVYCLQESAPTRNIHIVLWVNEKQTFALLSHWDSGLVRYSSLPILTNTAEGSINEQGHSSGREWHELDPQMHAERNQLQYCN